VDERRERGSSGEMKMIINPSYTLQKSCRVSSQLASNI